MSSPLRDIAGAAEWLGVKPTWVRDQVTARTIPFCKVGRHIRFSDEHLAAIVAAGEQQPVKAPSIPLVLLTTRKRRTAHEPPTAAATGRAVRPDRTRTSRAG